MGPYTHEEFYRELRAYRDLMGDRGFWQKDYENRQIAIKAITLVYFNTEPTDDKIANSWEAAINEYTLREGLMLKHGLLKE